jgi:outer membrane protein assembly factor BamD
MVLRSYVVLISLTAALVAAGCSGSGRLRYDSPQEAYQKGVELYERGKYQQAAEYFQAVFDFGRTHEWADDAQLYLARAYRANEQYILAASEYTRFVEIYRADPRVPEAEYERALAYYELSPNYELDQSDTERAIQYFTLFANRYPDHELFDEATARIAELRDKLAHKQFETAKLYERRELYEAAALSYEAVFDKYPDTAWADDALVGAIRAYIGFSDQSVLNRQAERLQFAVDNYERLIQIFPNSPLLKEGEQLYEQAVARLEALGVSPS